MNLNTLKLAALNVLMKWIAGELWNLAQDAVELFAQRDDLSGDEKMARARRILSDHAREAGASLRTSFENFLLESAVQLAKARAK